MKKSALSSGRLKRVENIKTLSNPIFDIFPISEQVPSERFGVKVNAPLKHAKDTGLLVIEKSSGDFFRPVAPVDYKGKERTKPTPKLCLSSPNFQALIPGPEAFPELIESCGTCTILQTSEGFAECSCKAPENGNARKADRKPKKRRSIAAVCQSRSQSVSSCDDVNNNDNNFSSPYNDKSVGSLRSYCPARDGRLKSWSVSRSNSQVFSTHSSREGASSSELGMSTENDSDSKIIETKRKVSFLVDQLLIDIAKQNGNRSSFDGNRSDQSFSDYFNRTTDSDEFLDDYGSVVRIYEAPYLQKKGIQELRLLIESLKAQIVRAGNRLVWNLKKRDFLVTLREKNCDVITAFLQAHSKKRSEDTRMKFSVTPSPGDSGFGQWHSAMKMVARLPEGIPQEFRKTLWLTLAERHLAARGVDWAQVSRGLFNEWTNPDDEELGVQIVKDLHRTGCSLFCGQSGQHNQAVLKRVLLAYARWNKVVGYCQGFNMLAALILQVMDRSQPNSVKVMIYLIEGVLPESYFANNLRGLSVDMAVFRELLKLRFPALSKHLDQLQNDSKDSGTSYEPPLTNVFTMQWFLTLFCNCLPQAMVLRVWDLIFLEGNEVLLKTALAIWDSLSDRIMAVDSADEFYSIMGVLTREMLEIGLMDADHLVKAISGISLPELGELREKYMYNITPWSAVAKRGLRLFYSDEDTDTSDDEEKVAVATAYALFRSPKHKDQLASDREKIALDISALKKQYCKLRERQRQAHIILSAACSGGSLGVGSPMPPAMNHLLLNKKPLLTSKTHRLPPPPGSIPPPLKQQSKQSVEKVDESGETIQWECSEKKKNRGVQRASSATESIPTDHSEEVSDISNFSSRRNSRSSSSSSSTELCDDPEDDLSDFESSPVTVRHSVENPRQTRGISGSISKTDSADSICFKNGSSLTMDSEHLQNINCKDNEVFSPKSPSLQSLTNSKEPVSTERSLVPNFDSSIETETKSDLDLQSDLSPNQLTLTHSTENLNTNILETIKSVKTPDLSSFYTYESHSNSNIYSKLSSDVELSSPSVDVTEKNSENSIPEKGDLLKDNVSKSIFETYNTLENVSINVFSSNSKHDFLSEEVMNLKNDNLKSCPLSCNSSDLRVDNVNDLNIAEYLLADEKARGSCSETIFTKDNTNDVEEMSETMVKVSSEESNLKSFSLISNIVDNQLSSEPQNSFGSSNNAIVKSKEECEEKFSSKILCFTEHQEDGIKNYKNNLNEEKGEENVPSITNSLAKPENEFTYTTRFSLDEKTAGPKELTKESECLVRSDSEPDQPIALKIKQDIETKLQQCISSMKKMELGVNNEGFDETKNILIEVSSDSNATLKCGVSLKSLSINDLDSNQDIKTRRNSNIALQQILLENSKILSRIQHQKLDKTFSADVLDLASRGECSDLNTAEQIREDDLSETCSTFKASKLLKTRQCTSLDISQFQSCKKEEFSKYSFDRKTSSFTEEDISRDDFAFQRRPYSCQTLELTTNGVKRNPSKSSFTNPLLEESEDRPQDESKLSSSSNSINKDDFPKMRENETIEKSLNEDVSSNYESSLKYSSCRDDSGSFRESPVSDKDCIESQSLEPNFHTSEFDTKSLNMLRNSSSSSLNDQNYSSLGKSCDTQRISETQELMSPNRYNGPPNRFLSDSSVLLFSKMNVQDIEPEIFKKNYDLAFKEFCDNLMSGKVPNPPSNFVPFNCSSECLTSLNSETGHEESSVYDLDTLSDSSSSLEMNKPVSSSQSLYNTSLSRTSESQEIVNSSLDHFKTDCLSD